VFGIVGCVRATLVQAQEPSPKQEAINLLRQASELVSQNPGSATHERGSGISADGCRSRRFFRCVGNGAFVDEAGRPRSRLGSIAYSLDYQGRIEEALQLLSEVSSEQAWHQHSILAKSHADKKDFGVALQLAHLIQYQPARREEALLAIANHSGRLASVMPPCPQCKEALEVAEQAREKEPQMSILLLGIARTQKEIRLSSWRPNVAHVRQRTARQERPPSSFLSRNKLGILSALLVPRKLRRISFCVRAIPSSRMLIWGSFSRACSATSSASCIVDRRHHACQPPTVILQWPTMLLRVALAGTESGAPVVGHSKIFLSAWDFAKME